MPSNSETIVYLDNHATTRVDPRVVEAMLPYFDRIYANPHSVHAAGHEAPEPIVLPAPVSRPAFGVRGAAGHGGPGGQEGSGRLIRVHSASRA